jgi:hypothetical protein
VFWKNIPPDYGLAPFARIRSGAETTRADFTKPSHRREGAYFLSSEINFRRSITNATEQVTEPRVFAQPLEAGLHVEPHELSGSLQVSGL